MQTRPYQFLTLACFLTLISGCGKTDNGPLNPGRAFTPSSITLKEHGALMELVDESLTFRDSSGVEWVAPNGTLTDGASVPRLALPITDGRWDAAFSKAAVVHDAYCQKDNETRCPDQYHKKPWKAVHRMFYEACIAGGTSELKAKSMFAAVWLFGPRWNDPEGELQKVPDEALTRGFTGSKKWIEESHPTVEEIEADIDRRKPLLRNLYELETATLAALQARDTNKARALLQKEETILNKALEKSPADSMLLNFRGYWHKNRAILYRELKNHDKANDELRDSQRAFKAVIEKDPADPSALNGLGSVSILRGDLDLGEKYVTKALAIEPNYEAAKHDLQLIKRLRESKSPQ